MSEDLNIYETHNNFTSAKTQLKLFHIKVHLEFLFNFHILEILESQESVSDLVRFATKDTYKWTCNPAR